MSAATLVERSPGGPYVAAMIRKRLLLPASPVRPGLASGGVSGRKSRRPNWRRRRRAGEAEGPVLRLALPAAGPLGVPDPRLLGVGRADHVAVTDREAVAPHGHCPGAGELDESRLGGGERDWLARLRESFAPELSLLDGSAGQNVKVSLEARGWSRGAPARRTAIYCGQSSRASSPTRSCWRTSVSSLDGAAGPVAGAFRLRRGRDLPE